MSPPNNKYEATIVLVYVMAILFFIIIGVFSFHIQPLVYSVLSCNAGSTLYCEMDPLVQISDSSLDTPNITYSTILEINYKTATTITQTIAFPYYATDGGSAVSYLYIQVSFTDSVGSDGTVIKQSSTDDVTLFNVGSEAGTLAAPITLECAEGVVTNEDIAQELITILTDKINNSKNYLFIETYNNNNNQFIYALLYDGTGTPTITVTGTDIENDESLLGFTSLVLNKDTFETHDSTVENANNGFLDIKLQQKAIKKYPSTVTGGCKILSARTSLKSSKYSFHPDHGLYYSNTINPPSSPTPCVYNSTNSNCGYNYVDTTDPSNASEGYYQTNAINYNFKNNTTVPVSTYYNGYNNGKNQLLTNYYGVAGDFTDITSYPQVQEKQFCAGFATSSSTKPWTKNNINNKEGIFDSEYVSSGDNSVWNFSNQPRLTANDDDQDDKPALPIKMGFN